MAENLLAVGGKEIAEMVGVSKRHWDALHSQGRVPRPVSLGRRQLWVVDVVRRWLAAGCPERSKWEMLDARQALA